MISLAAEMSAIETGSCSANSKDRHLSPRELMGKPSRFKPNKTSFAIFLVHFYCLISYYGLTSSCIVISPEQLEKNLCRSKVCPNYGKCVIDENGFFAKCVCPSECDYSTASSPSGSSSSSSQIEPYSGFSRKETKHKADRESISSELFSQTICGSDGKNYNNFCELKQQSCLQNKEIKIFYFGKCSKHPESVDKLSKPILNSISSYHNSRSM